MRRWKLTQAGLRDIEKDFATKHKGADKIYFDTEIKGFGFRCRRGGSRTWVLVYERNNEQRKLVLGPWPVLTPDQARSKAREEIGKVWLGADPQGSKAEERAKSRLTLLSVIEQYLQSSAVKELRQSSLTDVKRYLLGTDNVEHFRPLHKIPVHKIAKRDVAIILIKIANTAPVAAKSARSVLSGLFDWAIGEDLVTDNPVSRTNDPASGRPPRERVLTDEELAAIWKACRDDDHGKIVRLLILLGQRRDEVGGLKWSELKDNLWTLPRERAKNKRGHIIPLSRMAMSIVGSIERRDDNPHLFGLGAFGYSNWTIGKRSLDKRCQISGWRIHDIRRTVATNLQRLGIRLEVTEAILNHVSGSRGGIVGVYQRHDWAVEKRTALEMWADRARSIVEGTDRKIIPLQPISA